MPIPFLLAGLALGAVFLAGCATKADASKREPPKNPCDTFARRDEYHMVDKESFRAMNFLWGKKLSEAQLTKWHPSARLHAGAATKLFEPLCEKGQKVGANADVKKYVQGMQDFFEGYYGAKQEDTPKPIDVTIRELLEGTPGSKRRETQKDTAKSRRRDADNGLLVLIGGLAPAKLEQGTLVGALEALSGEQPKQREFAKLLRAAYHFNKAADASDAHRRFTAPRSSIPYASYDLVCLLKFRSPGETKYQRCTNVERTLEGSAARRRSARHHLAEFEKVLASIDASKLTDRQQNLLGAMQSLVPPLSKSLKKQTLHTCPLCACFKKSSIEI
jgi:hypothetical protein